MPTSPTDASSSPAAAPHPDPDNRCRLCLALLACEMPPPSRLTPELRNQFSRHPEICDACLAYDFALSGTDWKTVRSLIWLCLLLGLPLGVIALPFVLVIASIVRAPGAGAWWEPVPITLATGPLLIALALVAFPIYGKWRRRRRSAAEIDAEEAAARPKDAERFYCLALWSALRGRRAESRRLLDKAKQHGFADAARLRDPALKK